MIHKRRIELLERRILATQTARPGATDDEQQSCQRIGAWIERSLARLAAGKLAPGDMAGLPPSEAEYAASLWSVVVECATESLEAKKRNETGAELTHPTEMARTESWRG